LQISPLNWTRADLSQGHDQVMVMNVTHDLDDQAAVLSATAWAGGSLSRRRTAVR